MGIYDVNLKEERIGETNINNQGFKMVIINYIDNKNLDVQFEDGIIVTNRNYRDFKDGTIKHPNYKRVVKRNIDYEKSIGFLYPFYAELIVNDKRNNLRKEDTFTIAPFGKEKNFFITCPHCGKPSSKKRDISKMIKRGYSCEYCSDGFSIPEKFLANILKQLNIDFETHKSDFDWCKYKDKEYDVYIPNLSAILEAHGMQHYEEKSKSSNWRKNLEEEQANDRYKKHLAKKNGIKRYYSIDCRYSELEYMKNNIIKTLGHLFDLSNIDWELAWEECQKSKCVEAWEIYNNGEHDVVKISEILNLSKVTILRYLKRGAEIGKCDYTKEESIKIKGKKISKAVKGKKKSKGVWRNHHSATKVICITTKRMFYTITEAGEFYNIKSVSHICGSCKKNSNRKSCGKLEDGTPLVWRYIKIDHSIILRGKDISKLHSKSNQEVA